jgi:succinate dehydrogenase hydrophobic anchor subunit
MTGVTLMLLVLGGLALLLRPASWRAVAEDFGAKVVQVFLFLLLLLLLAFLGC